jgi:hypothetical protein
MEIAQRVDTKRRDMRQVSVILVVLLVCRGTYGLTLVGPSTAVLEGERFGLTFEYSQADTDLTFDLEPGEFTESFDWQTAYAVFSMAATERWDLFLRLGAAQAEATGFDGDMEFSWGFGTRATVLTWDDFAWGVLAQFTNLLSRYDTVEEFLIDDVPTLLEAKEDLRVTEYVFATGPTWRHDPFSLYGGLLVRYATGEFKVEADRVYRQADIDAEWDAGGYVGGRLTVYRSKAPHTYGIARGDLVAEGRFTGDSTAFSIGLLLPFGGQLGY